MKKPTKLQWVLIIVALVLMFLGQYFVPSVLGLSQKAMGGLCIFFGAILLLCFVDIYWPTFAVIIAVTTNGIYTYSEAAKLSYGNWITIFCLFVTLLSYALRQCGILKRVAIWIIDRPFAKKNPRRFVAVYLLATMIIGWLVDPVTTLIVMISILSEIFDVLGIKKGDKFAGQMMFGLLMIMNIAISGTPMAHVNAILTTNMLSSQYNMPYNMTNLMSYGCITGIIFLVLFILYFNLVYKPDYSVFKNFDSTDIKAGMKPMSKKERNILIIYICAIVLWVSPGILTFFWPEAAAFLNNLSLTFPAMAGCIVLALFHDEEGKPYLDLEDGFKNGVAWSVVAIISGTMLMGSLINDPQLGIIAALIDAAGPVVQNMPPLLIIFITTLFIVFLTNFTSNSVVQITAYSIIVPLIMSNVITGISPMALSAQMGMAANIAILTPMASGATAVFVSCGWCSLKDLFRWGIPLCILCVIFLTFIAYPIASLFL